MAGQKGRRRVAVTLIYETHSITTDNEAGFATGWLPGQLSPHGRELALELGERRCGEHIDAVFTSDLWRALETAQLAFGARGVPIVQDTRLRECNYGDLNGQPVALLASQRRQHIETPFPGGQSYREVIEATHAFLRDLARDWDGSRVLVIAHSANRWALECLLGNGVIEELVDAPFAWQEGWSYTVPDGWDGTA
jgi:alpha-ribazole phosphatase/probable phosphoglycerate mutase